MQLTIGQKQVQSQTMHQQMQQALLLLRMNALELSDYLRDIVVENPVLEMKESELPFDGSGGYRMPSEGNAFVRKSNNAAREDIFYETAQEISLCDDLLMQLGERRLRPRVSVAARAIIESLDERGYFTEPIGEIVSLCGVSAEEARAGLEAVQSLEPAGIGAANLSEFLCLQLKRKGIREEEPYRIARDYLPELAKGNDAKIATGLGVTRKEAQRYGELIRSLNPSTDHAGRHEMVQYVYPEVAVTRHGDSLEVRVDQRRLPELSINREYRELVAGNKEAKTYLSERYAEARRLIGSLDLWKTTLQRVAECIVEAQKNFFLKKGALEALSLSDLSDRLGVNASTVSRAIAGKHLICEWGVYSLKHFLVRNLTGKDGEKVSSDYVQAVMRRLLKSDPSLTDTALAELLNKQGIGIARRTVAKYRMKMGIKSVYNRGKQAP